MFIEAPTTTPEVTTDKTLDHLYKLRELVSHSEFWCSGNVSTYVGPREGYHGHAHCVLGLAVIAIGGNPLYMRTSAATEYINRYDFDFHSCLNKASSRLYSTDPISVNDGHGREDVIRIVDRAIEDRKASL